MRLVALLLLVCSLSLWAKGPALLIPVEKGVNRGEYYLSLGPLQALGYQIDLASKEGGTVLISNKGVPDTKGRDITGTVALKDVKSRHYLGVLVPGGYSPGHLESSKAARDLMVEFHEMGKPMGAVCHGPRLFLKAGIMGGHVFTHLHDVSTEIPDTWLPEGAGYVDQAVVVDRHFVTSRYPGDMAIFVQRYAELLHERGGIDPAMKKGTIGVWATGLKRRPEAGHRSWLWRDSLKVWGVKVVVVQGGELPEGIDQWLELGDNPAIDGHVLSPDAGDEEILKMLYAKSPKAELPSPTEDQRPKVQIALRRGFDDKVVASLMTSLMAKDFQVELVGHSKGWLKGHHGLPVEVTGTYGETEPGAWIIAPGGAFPELNTKARQGEKADWIEAQGERDAIRKSWIIKGYTEKSSKLWLFGLDSLRMGKGEEVFNKMSFSSPDSTRWSYGKGPGPRFKDDEVRESSDRLLTAKGASSLPEILRSHL